MIYSSQLLFHRLYFNTFIQILISCRSRLVNGILWEAIELDDALHWLSTLGGAYSNLGEHSQSFVSRFFFTYAQGLRYTLIFVCKIELV